MKLYIPTCTLNFNNILTTESISPYSFYEKRGFGNKRFYKVEANSLDNNIILYSKCPIFTVDNNEMENYPMVIEIETNDYKNDKFVETSEQDGVKIYFSNSTIYLNHYNCVVYFQNQDELDYTFITAEQSLEIKYRELYKENLRIIENLEDNFYWQQSVIENIQDTEIYNDSLEEDIFINKIKGLVFCYLIGENKYNPNKDIVKLEHLKTKIETTLSKIYDSEKKKANKEQQKHLDSWIKEINEIINFNYILPETKNNKDLLNNALDDLNLNTIQDKFCETDKTNFEKYNYIINCIDRLKEEIEKTKKKISFISFNAEKELKDLLKLLKGKSKPEKKSDSYNTFLTKISELIQKIINYEQENRCYNFVYSPTFIKNLFNLNDKTISITYDNKTGTYYESLVNLLIKDEYDKEHNGEPLKKDIGIAFSAGKKFKEFYNQRRKSDEPIWEDSEYQKYVNSLLGNLQGNESFDISQTNHLILKCLAAFCKKGESEIDRLIKYMQEFAFVDYKFTLGLYGADKGFATLPKTFTNDLINNYSYYEKFFDELHNLLFGYKIFKFVKPDVESQKPLLDYLNINVFINNFWVLYGENHEIYIQLVKASKNFENNVKIQKSDEIFLDEIYLNIGTSNKEKYKKEIERAFLYMKTGNFPKKNEDEN